MSIKFSRTKLLSFVFLCALVSGSFPYIHGQGLTPLLGKQFSDVSKDTQDAKFVPGQVVIKFKASELDLKTSKGQKGIQSFATTQSMKSVESIASSNIAVMGINDQKSVEQKVIELNANPSVEYAEPNYIYHLQTASYDDADSGNLRGLALISGYQAFEVFTGNPNPSVTGTIVAVLDAGVAYDHEDLINNMRDGSSCKDENGAALGSCIHGYDFGDDDLDPYPVRSDHGTHVAGTIAAEAHNGSGIIGVNFNARIMAVRLGDTITLANIIKGIDFARQNNAKIINASFGGTEYSTGMYNAISGFKSAGGLFVTSAGNGQSYGNASGDNHDTLNQHVYPCDYTLDNIVCVAATDAADDLASFSDYGATSVDVGAPGVNIYSTLVDITTTTGEYADFTATGNCAAPAVIAACAANLPACPIECTQTGTLANRGVLDSGIPARGNVFYADTGVPYISNANSRVEKTVDTSSASGITIDFRAVCDTEYDTGNRTDYMTLEVSNDGNTFTPIAQWDEPMLDVLNGDPEDSGGSAAYEYSLNLTGLYASASFRIRFRWTSNTGDNNYDGCLIDDLLVKTYNADTVNETYGYMDGTSMAAPHVAGLASLVWSMNPSVSYSSIRNAIIRSGDAIASLAGKTVSGTRINAYNTLMSFIDTQDPSITITSHTSGANITGNTVTITGTGTDNFAVSGVLVNGVLATGTGSRSAGPLVITGGDNVFTITGFDLTGNTTGREITLIRVPYTTGIVATLLSGSSVRVNFGTDITATGHILYGTSSLNLSESSGSVTSHAIILSGLSAGTTYIYRAYATTGGFTGIYSATGTFITPPSSATIVVTGASITGDSFFSGATTTGYTSPVLGQVYIITTGTATDKIGFNLSGLVMTGSGGPRNGTVYPITTSGVAAFGETGMPSALWISGITTITRQIMRTVQDGAITYALIANGNKFTLDVVVSSGTSGLTLKIYRSANGSTREANTPTSGASCVLNASLICQFVTDRLEYFTFIKETTTTTNNNNPGGGGAGDGTGAAPLCVLSNLMCRNGIYVIKTGVVCTGGSLLGDDCPVVVKTGIAPVVTGGIILHSPYTTEFNNAYLYAFSVGITTMPTIQQANMEGNLLRAHMAKMMVNYAVKEMGLKPNTGAVCTFDDIANESTEMKGYIKLACQLGIMGINVTSFTPNNTVTRAQFGTVLSRVLWGTKYNTGGIEYYTQHLNALRSASIITNTTPTITEIRAYVMIMLKRASELVK